MNNADLRLDRAPPFSVPLRFFLTAPVFGIAACLLLLLRGPGALASRWTDTLLAATHLFTLGFLTMAMMGALLQLLPVLAGCAIARPRTVAGTVHILMVVGTILLATSFLIAAPALRYLALGTLAVGISVFVIVTLYNLLRARSSPVVNAMRVAVAALGVTAALGVVIGAGHRFGVGPVAVITDTHLSWGLIGWVAVLVTGVAFQVVPMFQLTRAYPLWLRHSLAPTLSLALLLGTFAISSNSSAARWIGLAAIILGAAALVIFAITTLRLQRTRRRRIPDATVRYWMLSMACLISSITLWTAQAVGLIDDERLMLLAGAWMIAGFGSSVITGMLYKIVPFLAWLHLHAQGVRYVLPNMKTLLPDSRSLPHTWLHAVALILLAPAVLFPDSWLFPAAFALLASYAWLGWNIAAAALHYRRIRIASRVPPSTEQCSTT